MVYFPQCIASNGIFCMYRRSRRIVMKHTLLTKLILILHFRHVLSPLPHMSSCTKYAIGTNTLWEVLHIFSWFWQPMQNVGILLYFFWVSAKYFAMPIVINETTLYILQIFLLYFHLPLVPSRKVAGQWFSNLYNFFLNL